MDLVYVVMHVHGLPDGNEDIKLIGVYSDEAKANEAVQRLRGQPGFRDYPDEFEVNAITLNQDGWSEGFICWKEAMEDPSASTR